MEKRYAIVAGRHHVRGRPDFKMLDKLVKNVGERRARKKLLVVGDLVES